MSPHRRWNTRSNSRLGEEQSLESSTRQTLHHRWMRQSSRIIRDAKRCSRDLQNDSTRETSADVQRYSQQKHSTGLQEIHARREFRFSPSTIIEHFLFQPMEIYIDNETKLSLDVSGEKTLRTRTTRRVFRVFINIMWNYARMRRTRNWSIWSINWNSIKWWSSSNPFHVVQHSVDFCKNKTFPPWKSIEECVKKTGQSLSLSLVVTERWSHSSSQIDSIQRIQRIQNSDSRGDESVRSRNGHRTSEYRLQLRYARRYGYLSSSRMSRAVSSSRSKREWESFQVARAGRFGTKGLAVTFVADENDATILSDVQTRFEVQITEMPDEIDVASYSKSIGLQGSTSSFHSFFSLVENRWNVGFLPPSVVTNREIFPFVVCSSLNCQ